MSDPNGVIFQSFHWYSSSDGTFWNQLKNRAGDLANAGFTAIWLPPPFKGAGGASEVGYGVYDLYDLGEFDQKGTTRTKYGTKDEYVAAISTLKEKKLMVFADIVLNHRMAGDNLETSRAVAVYKDNRLSPKGELHDVTCYTHFQFAGRGQTYSSFEWHWYHFDAIDYKVEAPDDDSIYVFEGKSFDSDVCLENGNFDYLMGCDVDFEHEDVRKELLEWGKWYLDTTGVEAFRLDAVKHIPAWFFPEWLEALRTYSKKELVAIGEYWESSKESLLWYLDATKGQVELFDVPLHFNFYRASKAGQSYDMRTIFDGTLVQQCPTLAVTFVSNHDCQPLQSLESVVEAWFTPIAYALILLRRSGFPCVFAPDYDGAEYEDKGSDGNTYKIVLTSHKVLLDVFLKVRRENAYGEEYDYFDNEHVIGWTRLGDESHKKAIAVVLSNGEGGTKSMEVKRVQTEFIDLTGHREESVKTNDQGWGDFPCNGGSVSVWVER